MSTSDLYLLFGKSVRHWSEHRNGWGSAPLCWDYLGEKYIPDYKCNWRDVWPLNAGDRLTQPEQAALLFTLDNAYVPVSDLAQVADWFEQFADETEADPKSSGRANHWRAFAEELRKVNATVKDKRLRGVCVTCTSVNEVWVYKKDFSDVWSITQDTPND